MSAATPVPECEWVTGDRVQILNKGVRGTVRFCGLTEFAQGVWVGVELDEPAGKNNGEVKGKSYFECEPLHGIFLRASSLQKERASRQAGTTDSMSGASPAKKKATLKKEVQSMPAAAFKHAEAAIERAETATLPMAPTVSAASAPSPVAARAVEEAPVATAAAGGVATRPTAVGASSGLSSPSDASASPASRPSSSPKAAATSQKRDRLRTERQLAEAVEAYDVGQIRSLLPKAVSQGVAALEIEGAQRILDFEQHGAMRKDVEDVSASVRKLMESVDDAQARLRQLVEARLEDRLWLEIKPKVEAIVEARTADVFKRLQDLSASQRETVEEPTVSATDIVHSASAKADEAVAVPVAAPSVDALPAEEPAVADRAFAPPAPEATDLVAADETRKEDVVIRERGSTPVANGSIVDENQIPAGPAAEPTKTSESKGSNASCSSTTQASTAQSPDTSNKKLAGTVMGFVFTLLVKKDAAATKLQAVGRGFLGRKQLRESKAAATKIQAARRGHVARKGLQEQARGGADVVDHKAAVDKSDEAAEPGEEEQKLEEAAAEPDEKEKKMEDAAQEAAATKIQSVHRGCLVRKGAQERGPVKDKAAIDKSDEADEPGEEEQKLEEAAAEPNEKEKNLEDAAQEAAATKIQSVHRGRLVRKGAQERGPVKDKAAVDKSDEAAELGEEEQKLEDAAAEPDEKEKKMEDAAQEAAATKIQSMRRGYLVRKSAQERGAAKDKAESMKNDAVDGVAERASCSEEMQNRKLASVVIGRVFAAFANKAYLGVGKEGPADAGPAQNCDCSTSADDAQANIDEVVNAADLESHPFHKTVDRIRQEMSVFMEAFETQVFSSGATSLDMPGFERAICSVQPMVSPQQAKALFKGCEERGGGSALDLKMFCEAAEAVATSEEASAEFAGMPLAEYVDLGKMPQSQEESAPPDNEVLLGAACQCPQLNEESAARKIQRAVRQLLCHQDRPRMSIATVARRLQARSAEGALVFKDVESQQSRDGPGLDRDGFSQAFVKLHPWISKKQLDAVFDGYQEGASQLQDTGEGLMDLHTFLNLSEAASIGPDAVAEYADMTERSFLELGNNGAGDE